MTIKLGLVGTGTVGGGCVRILQKHREDFASRYGIDVELVRVCSLVPEQAAELGVSDIFTLDYHDVVNDPDIDIVIELIGGTTVARSIVTEALKAGKNVVTANKALMATYGQEILDLAAEKGLEVAFEASVGGGIPIIDPLSHNLIANDISSVMGIVNGTTNYMLTRMASDGMSYDEALREAQSLGYAEADPTADVDGFDAAAKIAILANLAFGSRVTLSDVHAEGIRAITPLDLELARKMGYSVKLLAIANRTPEGVVVRVHPTMLPLSHQLSAVNGVFNAIYVVGDAVGETMFFGAGAGSGPAASAVMGDVLEVARRMARKDAPASVMGATRDLPILPLDQLKSRYYIRFRVTDRVGVLASIAGIFAEHGVSILSVSQSGVECDGAIDLVYVTHTTSERAVRGSLAEIALLEDTAHGPASVIRVVE